MKCRLCGRETGDRHSTCWRCQRGLPSWLTLDDVEVDVGPGVCRCPVPEPTPVRLFGHVLVAGATECRLCGRPVP